MVAAAVVGAAAISTVGGALAADAQGNAIGDAAGASAAATAASIAESRRQFDLTRSDFAPYRDTGVNALGELAALYGVGRYGMLPAKSGAVTTADGRQIAPQGTPRITTDITGSPEANALVASRGGWAAGPVPIVSGSEAPDYTVAYGGSRVERHDLPELGAGGISTSMEEARNRFTTTPGYEFRRDEGLKAVERSAAARGLLESGPTMKAIDRYAEGLASSEFENYANRLASLAGIGQSATSQGAQIGAALSGNISNSIMTGGANQASSYLAAGQARANTYAGIGNSISGGVQNYMLYDALRNRGGTTSPGTIYSNPGGQYGNYAGGAANDFTLNF